MSAPYSGVLIILAMISELEPQVVWSGCRNCSPPGANRLTSGWPAPGAA